jgi:hypothetical protein
MEKRLGDSSLIHPCRQPATTLWKPPSTGTRISNPRTSPKSLLQMASDLSHFSIFKTAVFEALIVVPHLKPISHPHSCPTFGRLPIVVYQANITVNAASQANITYSEAFHLNLHILSCFTNLSGIDTRAKPSLVILVPPSRNRRLACRGLQRDIAHSIKQGRFSPVQHLHRQTCIGSGPGPVGPPPPPSPGPPTRN